jgi:hypothetical protein
MIRLCLWVMLAAGCAPATRELALRTPAPAVAPGLEASGAQQPRRKRVARLAPPFVSSASTRHVDESPADPSPVATLPDPVELAIAR